MACYGGLLISRCAPAADRTDLLAIGQMVVMMFGRILKHPSALSRGCDRFQRNELSVVVSPASRMGATRDDQRRADTEDRQR
jgi:hypothetical protein